MSERYLSIPEVAEILGTTTRFPRRLVAERRIEYQKIGRHVRIAQSVLEEFIAQATVPARYRRAALWHVASAISGRFVN